jgi:hypothetical protein
LDCMTFAIQWCNSCKDSSSLRRGIITEISIC